MTNVSPFKTVEETVKQRLVRTLSEGIDTFKADCGKDVTAVAYVLMSDDGLVSVGWITEDHPWPSAAVLGMAARAILIEKT